MLFDLASGSALCVVDLDTVMSGSLLHDFGDLCRSVCSLCPEDGMGPDGEMLSPEVDEGLFRAVCSGFIDGAGAVLSDLESELLVLSAQVSLSTAVCRPFSLGCVFTPMPRCVVVCRQSRRSWAPVSSRTTSAATPTSEPPARGRTWTGRRCS